MKKITKKLSIVMFILTLSLSTVLVKAEGFIAESFTGGREMILYIKGLSEKVTDVSAQVGTYLSSQSSSLGNLSEQSDYKVKTMILLDNSLSIKSSGRDDKIKELLTAIINGHTQNEEFSISTFSTSVEEVTSFTSDYNELINTVNSITYNDQDAYLVSAIYSSVQSLMSNESEDYKRLIVISDGVDDNHGKSGYTSTELIGLLEESGCQLYTIGCTWEKDESGLSDLFSYSRKAGGESFELDAVEDVNQIVSKIQEDYNVQLVKVTLPLDTLDGGDKKIQLTINGGTNIVGNVTMPFISADQIEQWRQEELSETESEQSDFTYGITIHKTTQAEIRYPEEYKTGVEEDKEYLQVEPGTLVSMMIIPKGDSELENVIIYDAKDVNNEIGTKLTSLDDGKYNLDFTMPESDIIMTLKVQEIETEEETEIAVETEKKNNLDKVSVLLPKIGMAVFSIILVIAAIISFMGNGKKKSKDHIQKKLEDLPKREEVKLENREKENNRERWNETEVLDDEDEKTVVLEEEPDYDDEGEKTMLLWNDSKKIVLENMSSGQKYALSLSGNMIIGRSKEADLRITGDPTISGRHCRLSMEHGNVYIKDIGSSNGTKYNGLSLSDKAILHNGDTIQLGNTVFIVIIK